MRAVAAKKAWWTSSPMNCWTPPMAAELQSRKKKTCTGWQRQIKLLPTIAGKDLTIEAIAKIDNCQRIQIESLLFRCFGLNHSISATFGNTGNFGNRARFKY